MIQDIDVFYKKLQARCMIGTQDENYKKKGFKIWFFDKETSSQLENFFIPNLTTRFSRNDYYKSYLSSALDINTELILNQQNIFYSSPEANNPSIKKLEIILSSIKEDILNTIGYTFKVVNVRAWKTKQYANFGGSGWHTDGTNNSIKKILIYPNPLNRENGSLEIEDYQGIKHLLTTSHPTIVLADVGVLKHRGISPIKEQFRPMIEVTIVPHPITRVTYTHAGHNARYPLIPTI